MEGLASLAVNYLTDGEPNIGTQTMTTPGGIQRSL